MTAAFIPGFLLGFSLILAIGAQNAFVLRQGLRREHVFAVCLTCAVSDALLIAAGVAGFGVVVESAPWIQPVFRWAGAAFLFVYGLVALASAVRGGSGLKAEADDNGNRRRVILTVLAFTWLNPHVYLDTVVLLGSIGAQFEASGAFAAGAVTASFVFFFSLAYGARSLSPFFAEPRTWRLLDGSVGVVMWALAAKLLLA